MGYSSAQAKQFIAYIAPMIQSEAKARGYKICSTVIAQAIIEGAAGTSSLAKLYHNHFGMKCGKSWKGKSVNLKTKEEYGAGLVTIRDNFRIFESDEQGVKGYYDFISASRYDNLKTATTYKEYAERLKSDGYATSSSYVQTLCNTVTRYNLGAYDEATETVPLHIQKRRLLKFTLPMMQGSDVVYCQRILQNLGYDLGKTGVDSKYGKRTEEAIKAFQRERSLVDDGKVGPKTWAMLEKYNEN